MWCRPRVSTPTAAVRPDITVVTVTSTVASIGTAPPTSTTPQAQGKTVRALQDPTSSLRTHLGLGVPFLRKPVGRFLLGLEHKWVALKRRWQRRAT